MKVPLFELLELLRLWKGFCVILSWTLLCIVPYGEVCYTKDMLEFVRFCASEECSNDEFLTVDCEN